MGFESDEDAGTELLLYLDNEEPLYRQKLAIARNLELKMKRGTYDHAKAPQAWSYVVEAAAKRYAKEFDVKWSTMFNPATRRVVSKALADRWHANAKAGRPDEV